MLCLYEPLEEGEGCEALDELFLIDEPVAVPVAVFEELLRVALSEDLPQHPHVPHHDGHLLLVDQAVTVDVDHLELHLGDLPELGLLPAESELGHPLAELLHVGHVQLHPQDSPLLHSNYSGRRKSSQTVHHMQQQGSNNDDHYLNLGL